MKFTLSLLACIGSAALARMPQNGYGASYSDDLSKIEDQISQNANSIHDILQEEHEKVEAKKSTTVHISPYAIAMTAGRAEIRS